MCISTSAHGAFSYEMEQGLLGCGGSNVPSGGKVLRKPFTRLQQEGLLLALACRCCPAYKVCPAVPAFARDISGWLDTAILAPGTLQPESHQSSEVFTQPCSMELLLQECAGVGRGQEAEKPGASRS